MEIEKYLSEDDIKNESIQSGEWSNTVKKAAKLCKWSSIFVADFVRDLMEECDLPKEAKDISSKIRKIKW